MGESSFLNSISRRVRRPRRALFFLLVGFVIAACGDLDSAARQPGPKSDAGMQVQDEAKELMLRKLESMSPEKRAKMLSIMGETLVDEMGTSGNTSSDSTPKP